MFRSSRRRTGALYVAGIATAAGLLLSAAAASAATIAPDAFTDAFADDSDCTLREALVAANTDSNAHEDDCAPGEAGGDVIPLAAGTYQLSVPGTNEDASADGDLDVLDTTTIAGAGAAGTTIVQTVVERVLHADMPSANDDLLIEDLTITGGRATAPGDAFGGGTLLEGSGTQTLRSVAVDLNSAVGATDDAEGGGVFVQAIANPTVTIEDSTISNNVASRTDGDPNAAPGGGGIAIRNGVAATTTITGSTIGPSNQVVAPGSTSTFPSGGGLLEVSSGVTVEDTTIRDNSSVRAGGAFSNSADFTMRRSTVEGNAAAGGSGGGMVLFGTPTIVNSTVSGNTSSADGGGIRASGAGTKSVDQSTIAGNQGGLGDGISAVVASVELRRTILANTGGDECEGSTFASLEDNLQPGNDPDCAFGPGDHPGSNPGLGPLADNGGATETRALGSGSAARDAIASADCPAAPLDEDQRGVARPGAGSAACDIGAFEYSDGDADGVEEGVDNCPNAANPGQQDADLDGIGNVCDDGDGDGVADPVDNCPNAPNAGQADSDGDGAGDACDPTPHGSDVNLELSAKRKAKAGRPVKATAICPQEACDVSAQATHRLPGKGLAGASSKQLTTGTATVSLAAGEAGTLKLKLKRKQARKLKRAAKRKSFRKRVKVKVAATATDLGGNTETEKLTLRLKG